METWYVPVEVPDGFSVKAVYAENAAVGYAHTQWTCRIVGAAVPDLAVNANTLPLDQLPEGYLGYVVPVDGSWRGCVYPVRNHEGKIWYAVSDTPRQALLNAIAAITPPKTREERLEDALRELAGAVGCQPAGDDAVRTAYDAAIKALKS